MFLVPVNLGYLAFSHETKVGVVVDPTLTVCVTCVRKAGGINNGGVHQATAASGSLVIWDTTLLGAAAPWELQDANPTWNCGWGNSQATHARAQPHQTIPKMSSGAYPNRLVSTHKSNIFFFVVPNPLPNTCSLSTGLRTFSLHTTHNEPTNHHSRHSEYIPQQKPLDCPILTKVATDG